MALSRVCIWLCVQNRSPGSTNGEAVAQMYRDLEIRCADIYYTSPASMYTNVKTIQHNLQNMQCTHERTHTVAHTTDFSSCS